MTTTTHPLQSQDSSGIDEATFQTIRFVFSVILFPAVGVIGTVSNFFAIVVLAKQGLTHSSNVSMFNMAIAEFLVSALVLCVYTDGLIGDFNSPAVRAFLKIRDEIIYPIRAVTRSVSSLCVPLMTIERFVAICFPFAASGVFSKRKTIIFHLCLWLVVVLYMLPSSVLDVFEYERKETIPYATTTCLSVAIGVRLRRTVIWRKKQQQQSFFNAINRNSGRVTKIILVLAVFFIISQLPYNYLCAVCFVDKTYCLHTKSRAFMVNRYWISFVGSLNYTTTFYVYLAFNERFRKIFIDTFFRCCNGSRGIVVSKT
ncbi:kappa-type opioid receptor-like [Aplysia californica]|uniref:Kappa-type opioid receptor-like n=1 Tax=Aplysia californica TaxID=6500 RepID=A0ABM0JZL7_APLCA|nr:kappa-type opioid receptor-like [Aplysia californica]